MAADPEIALASLDHEISCALLAVRVATSALDVLITGPEPDIEFAEGSRGPDLANDLADAARFLRSAQRIVAARIEDMFEQVEAVQP